MMVWWTMVDSTLYTYLVYKTVFGLYNTARCFLGKLLVVVARVRW